MIIGITIGFITTIAQYIRMFTTIHIATVAFIIHIRTTTHIITHDITARAGMFRRSITIPTLIEQRKILIEILDLHAALMVPVALKQKSALPQTGALAQSKCQLQIVAQRQFSITIVRHEET